jgi:hypothetical protein
MTIAFITIVLLVGIIGLLYARIKAPTNGSPLSSPKVVPAELKSSTIQPKFKIHKNAIVDNGLRWTMEGAVCKLPDKFTVSDIIPIFVDGNRLELIPITYDQVLSGLLLLDEYERKTYLFEEILNTVNGESSITMNEITIANDDGQAISYQDTTGLIVTDDNHYMLRLYARAMNDDTDEFLLLLDTSNKQRGFLGVEVAQAQIS